MQLELGQLHIEGGTQPREKINEEAVAEYAAALRAGDTFPRWSPSTTASSTGWLTASTATTPIAAPASIRSRST